MSVPNFEAPAARPGETALYQFFTSVDELLYVGITRVPARRWAHHRRFAATTWWCRAARVTVEWFTCRQDAVDAELRIIRTAAPLYNSGGAPSPLRKLEPGERLCPHTNTDRFYEATRGGFTPPGRRWRNMDVAVAETLAEDIGSGEFGAGDPLPSGSALVNHFGVSLGTIQRATLRLVASGTVEARGTGSARRYFVASGAD